nr:putative nuclease HARBI1 [Rhipicephalus microplus]
MATVLARVVQGPLGCGTKTTISAPEESQLGLCQDSWDPAPRPRSRPRKRLLMALRFYDAGTFQTVTGDLVHIPQSTVCRAVGKVTTLIAKHLYFILMRFPQPPEFQQVMRDFYKVAEFPSVTGCIDCTHVQIKSPGGENAEVLHNRKGYFSFNVQAVAGPQLQFFDIVVGWPGFVHDSRILDNSRLRVL